MANFDVMCADLDDDILERLIVNSDAIQGFYLLNRIIESCRRHIPKKHITINNLSWINNDVKQTIARRQRAYNARKRNNTDETSVEYFTARQQVKRAVKQAKRNKELNVARLCNTNSKGFYSYINERRIIRDNVGPLKTHTGQIVTTDIDMANTLQHVLQFSVHPRTTEQHSTAPHICRQHSTHSTLD